MKLNTKANMPKVSPIYWILYGFTALAGLTAIGCLVCISICYKTWNFIASIIFMEAVLLLTTKIFIETCKQIEINNETYKAFNRR